MSLEKDMEEEARLAILKELAKEDNKAMSSARMQKFLLRRLLINKPREWVERQYLYLKDINAVTVLQADTVILDDMIARIRAEFQVARDYDDLELRLARLASERRMSSTEMRPRCWSRSSSPAKTVARSRTSASSTRRPASPPKSQYVRTSSQALAFWSRASASATWLPQPRHLGATVHGYEIDEKRYHAALARCVFEGDFVLCDFLSTEPNPV